MFASADLMTFQMRKLFLFFPEGANLKPKCIKKNRKRLSLESSSCKGLNDLVPRARTEAEGAFGG